MESAQTAVVKWRNATQLLKAAGKITYIRETQRLADGGNAVGGLFQLILCSANKLVIYVLANGNADFLSE